MVALSAVLGRQFKGSGIVGFGLLPFIGQSGQRRGWEASPWRSYFLGIKRILVAVTDSLGKFDVGKLPAGEQWLKVSFVGFRPLEQKVVLEGHTAVGDISLKALILDEVVVSARPPLTVQKGDTLQFNAAAVHLAEDADLEKLLKKLPGFEIVDGKIMAQGQEVKKSPSMGWNMRSMILLRL